MQFMDSAKTGLAVALADERLGGGWRRSRTGVRVVAVLCSVLAATIVFSLFNQFRVRQDEAKREKQLIASVDLSIGNTVLAAHRGEVQARQDLEAGLLQLQAFGAAPTKVEAARILQLKQRYGVTWVRKGETATPVAQAFADGYNRVMQAEIERRHGGESLDERLRELNVGPLAQEDRRSIP